MKMDIEQVKKEIVPILKKAGVTRSSLFGSVARGEANTSSDIDILVEFQKPVGFFSFCALQNELEDRLGRAIDLVTFESLNPLIKDAILRDAVPIV